jgi:hypothetical protein
MGNRNTPDEECPNQDNLRNVDIRAQRKNAGGGGGQMQVLCKSSDTKIEAQCSICGQGFTLYWERQTPTERAEALEAVESVLRDHHRSNQGAGAHPEYGFLVPAWDGPVAFSGAAILGNAPNSAF